MLIDICMTFRENSLNGFEVIEWTRLRHNFVTDKDPREITKKNINASRLMLVEICMKFHDASLNGLKVIARTPLRQDFGKVPRKITKKYKCKIYRSCTLQVI